MVRRTLLLPCAASVAPLWALHPLHTAVMTYVIQRAEAMVAVFYLLTIYCFVRSVECHLIDDTRLGPWTGHPARHWESVIY